MFTDLILMTQDFLF